MPRKKTKILVATLLLADIIFIVFFVFFFCYTKSLIANSVNEEDQIKTELKMEDTRAMMKGDLDSAKMYQEKLTDYMIPAGGTVDFIKTLEQSVLNSGLKSDIKNVSSETYDKGDSVGMESLKVDVDVIGEWKNIQFFLNSIENYPLKIDIKSVSLSKFSDYIKNNKKNPQWSESLEFTVAKIKDTI